MQWNIHRQHREKSVSQNYSSWLLSQKYTFFPLQNKWTLLNQLYSRLLQGNSSSLVQSFQCVLLPRPAGLYPGFSEDRLHALFTFISIMVLNSTGHIKGSINAGWIEPKIRSYMWPIKFSVCLLGWIIKQFIFICSTFSHPNVLYFLLGQPPCQLRNTRNPQVPLNSRLRTSGTIFSLFLLNRSVFIYLECGIINWSIFIYLDYGIIP